MKGYLELSSYQEAAYWLPLICLGGCLLAFWWIRYKLPSLPHSISATAYQSKRVFAEFCLFNAGFLTTLSGWRLYNYPLDTPDDWTIWIAALLLPWLAHYWDFFGRHRWQHYGLAAVIFGGLSFTFSRYWWQMILISILVGVFAKKHKIFWAEATLIHLIIIWQIVLNYIYYPF